MAPVRLPMLATCNARDGVGVSFAIALAFCALSSADRAVIATAIAGVALVMLSSVLATPAVVGFETGTKPEPPEDDGHRLLMPRLMQPAPLSRKVPEPELPDCSSTR